VQPRVEHLVASTKSKSSIAINLDWPLSTSSVRTCATNRAIFGVMDALLRKTLPVARPEQLFARRGDDFSYPAYETFREANSIRDVPFDFAISGRHVNPSTAARAMSIRWSGSARSIRSPIWE
jgi:hypothetical protein